MDTTPHAPARTLRDQDQVWSFRAIQRGEVVRPLPPHAVSLDDLTFEVGDVRFSVDDYMARRRTLGLLILKDGAIALERYAPGRPPERRAQSYSTAKSMTSTLVGAALHEGAIGGLDDRCGLYVPRLRGSAYEDVTIRNLMRMSSGMTWGEWDDPEGPDVIRLREALESQRPGSLLDLAYALPRAHPQGAVFSYSTVETCVLGAVVAGATGRPLADYFAERIWAPAGAEAHAYWALEAEDGLEVAGAGVMARLRDVGRFGLLMLADGEAFDGRRVLPAGWRDLAGQPDPDTEATAFGRLKPGDPGGYGYQWWVYPPGFAGGVHRGAFSAYGAHGQIIYINPAEQVVAVVQSAWSLPQDNDANAETGALIRTAVLALRTEA